MLKSTIFSFIMLTWEFYLKNLLRLDKTKLVCFVYVMTIIYIKIKFLKQITYIREKDYDH